MRLQGRMREPQRVNLVAHTLKVLNYSLPCSRVGADTKHRFTLALPPKTRNIKHIHIVKLQYNYIQKSVSTLQLNFLK